MVNDAEVIAYFMRTSKGIRAVARYFSLPVSYVGALINRYIKENNIRF
tara:strand:+ start:592 stop:735 length:144 start_codon:yes stop_codon:yes gene_type:complete